MTTTYEETFGNHTYLTDGGLETCLIFSHGIDLPEFAAFPLLGTETGRERLRRYYTRYLKVATEAGLGFLLDVPTWRASAGWGSKLGMTQDQVLKLNRTGANLAREIAATAPSTAPVRVVGSVGPSDDGYDPKHHFTIRGAADYHAPQIAALAEGGVDVIGVLTMTYVEEAIGTTLAAQETGIPLFLSFTVETDGKLPSGQPLSDAIAEVDAHTGNGPLFYMVNCAHPDHFADKLDDGAWRERVRGVRANASRLSHAELDCCEHLDDGDPVELAQLVAQLRSVFPNLSVLGGCCGTDHRHIAQMAIACRDIAA